MVPLTIVYDNGYNQSPANALVIVLTPQTTSRRVPAIRQLIVFPMRVIVDILTLSPRPGRFPQIMSIDPTAQGRVLDLLDPAPSLAAADRLCLALNAEILRLICRLFQR
jgi:hypothetical protein